MALDFDYLLKFIIIGDSAVGKTNIFSKFKEDKFDEFSQPSIGAQFLSKNISIDNNTFRLQVWDTAGQENFRSMTKTYYKNSACAFIVYDITEKESFQHLEYWLKECKAETPETLVLVLIGNKSDLAEKREVKYEDGLNFAKSNNMLFFEASEKNGENIEEIFKKSTECINNNIKEGKYNLEDDACGIKMCITLKNVDIESFDIESKEDKKLTNKKKCCK